MPILTTPPKLRDSGNNLANGQVFVKVTSSFPSGGDTVVLAAARGFVIDGVFWLNADGTGSFVLPETPTNVAVVLVLVLDEWRAGRAVKTSITRVVSVPAGATVTWDELEDVVPETASANFTVPAWVSALQTSVTAATSATDALVATNLGNPASATAIAIAAVVEPYVPRLANTMVIFADSFGYFNYGDPTHPLRPSFGSRGECAQANIFLGHRLNLINKGVGGEDTLALVARMATDLVAVAAGWAYISSLTNDISNGRTYNQITQNLTTLYDAAEASGKRVVGVTGPPRTSHTTPEKALLSQVNQWIRGQASTRPGFLVHDRHRSITDPLTFDFVTGYSYDGVHMTTPAAIASGMDLADLLRPHIPAIPIVLAAADPRNLLASNGGGFPGSAAAVPTGWTANGWSQGTPTYSKVARTDKPGQWQQILVPTDSRGFLRSTVLLMSGGLFAVGDTIRAAVEFDVSALEIAPTASTQALYITIEYYNGTTTVYRFDPEYSADANPAGGGTQNENQGNRSRSGVLFTEPFTIPAGGSAQSLAMTIQARCGGTYKFANATLMKV